MAEKEPQPDQFSKSIPLAGGVQEEAPEFRLNSPYMAYVENGRYRKADEIEKTLPWTDLEAPFSGPIRFVETIDDTIVVLSDDELWEYTEADGWVLREEDVFVTSMDNVLSSSPVTSATHFDWAESTLEDHEFYVVASETRAIGKDTVDLHDPAVAGERKVIIEKFSKSGLHISKMVVDNASCPQVAQMDDGRVIVYYCYTVSDGLLKYDTSTDTTDQVRTMGGAAINVYYGSPNFDTAAAAPISGGEGYNEYRAGLSRVGKNYWYKVYGDGSSAAILYSDLNNLSNGYPDLKAGRLGADGDIAFLEATLAPTPPGLTIQYYPLDIHIRGSRVCLAYASREFLPGGPVSRVYVVVGDSLFASLTHTVVSFGDFIVVNGSAYEESSSDPASYAFTKIDGQENDLLETLAGRVSIAQGITYEGSTIELGELRHHRLTSNIVRESGFATFAIEQWNIHNLHTEAEESDELNDRPYPALKPTSNILMRTGPANLQKPLAVFDAGQSRHTPQSMTEQSMFLGRLVRSGGNYLYLNRQVLQTEDYIEKPFLTAAADNMDRNIELHFGEARANLYEVTTNPDKLATVKFGKAVIINSSVPKWYVGGKLSELSILEQPEILAVEREDDFDKATGWAWSDALWDSDGSGDTGWTVYQVVVGYTDALGHVHRSAPSFPLYVDRLNQAGDDDQYRKIGFTLPVTYLANDDVFFVEIYAAEYGSAMHLTASSVFEPNLAVGGENIVLFREFVRGPDSDTNKAPIRYSEILYTTGIGGELPADPWLNFTQSVVTSRRMFTLVEGTVYFSKLFRENIAPELNGLLSIPFGRGRRLKGIGKIDDKVIVFDKTSIHAIYGDGPDNTGEARTGAFIVDPIQSTVGCEDPESIVEIPAGLLFYSSISGEFHLLTRDLEIQDIGKPVEDLSEDIDITAAIVFSDEHEVRWFVTGGPTEEFGPDPDTGAGIPDRPPRPRFTNVLPADPCFAFNYHYNKWTVLSDQSAISAAQYGSGLVRATTSDVYVTSEDWAGSPVLTYRTPWLRVQDLLNFGRIRKVDFLGKYLSAWKDNGGGHEAGDIEVEFAYNYEVNGDTTTYRWRANEDLNPVYGGRMEFSAKPGRPKCSAVQVTVSEVPTEKLDDAEPTYTSGRGFVLSTLDMIYSLKRGLGKAIGQPRSK